MKIEISSKNYFVKDNLKSLINKKVEKLGRYFKTTPTAKIFCTAENNGQLKLEITVIDKGIVFKSEKVSDNMYDNLDVVLPKVEKQIVKTLHKIRDKKKSDMQILRPEFVESVENNDDATEKLKVVKHKKFDLVPLTQEDAINNLENVDHDFYLYLSKETGHVHLLYKRKNGNLGEIEGVNDWEK